jgi:tRNA G46 methylase TrmB
MLLFKAPLHTLRKNEDFSILAEKSVESSKALQLGIQPQSSFKTPYSCFHQIKKTTFGTWYSFVLITSLVQKLEEHKDDGWFFDVGANVGLYVWEVAKVCPTRKILAIEPDPANFELLEMTQKEADLQNFELCPDAPEQSNR